ncbi:MAG: hypothetical protein J7J89_05570 [Thermoplasmata archaeon]|nr:hypothetical protein [Thermoplasmata archaeon]
MVTKGEMKKTIVLAIGSAFGFVIALIWRNIIVGADEYGWVKCKHIR